MDERLHIARDRIERAMEFFVGSGVSQPSLPPDAYQHFRFDEEIRAPEPDTIEPYVLYRQTYDVDVQELYRDLRGA